MTARGRQPGVAAIYARVSTERQATGDKTSLERQVKNCRRTADKLSLTVTAIDDYIIKEAHSGSDPDDRPGLQRLFAAATRGQFQYVLMDVVDRTTRAGSTFQEICTRFLGAGVEPIWASNPEWDMHDPDDRHEAAEAAWDAYKDKRHIARRFQEGKTERIEAGLLGSRLHGLRLQMG